MISALSRKRTSFIIYFKHTHLQLQYSLMSSLGTICAKQISVGPTYHLIHFLVPHYFSDLISSRQAHSRFLRKSVEMHAPKKIAVSPASLSVFQRKPSFLTGALRDICVYTHKYQEMRTFEKVYDKDLTKLYL